MPSLRKIEESQLRKESWNKVTGRARYTADAPTAGTLWAALLVSPHAHARILAVDTACARVMPGVQAVLTGADVPVLCGEEIRDRPMLAIDQVRYAGEPVAMAIADTQAEAIAAAGAVQIRYEPLPSVLSIREAAEVAAPLLHPTLAQYVRVSAEIAPEAGSNIVNRVKIRKGNAPAVWDQCTATVELSLSMPMSSHVATETRAAQAEVHPDGRVMIQSSTQAPHSVKALISDYFHVPCGLITVQVPLVGGGFGGKSAVQLELLCYAASRAVQGRPVRLSSTREQDMATSPGKEGLEADIKLGADAAGKLLAMEATYYVGCGAYANSIPRVARAVASDCSGPYAIPNLSCDALCVYTSHPYATAYRGFGHIATAFVMERAMDALAAKLNMDPFRLRQINAIGPGDTAPTQSLITLDNAGNFAACLQRLKTEIDWPTRAYQPVGGRYIRAMGLGCFWKAPSPKPDGTSGAILTFNADGSVNLHMAVVECGPGLRTMLAQLAAEALGMAVERVYVVPGFDTHVMPEHWKTVASLSMYLAGNATLRAAEDAKAQLKAIACTALHATADELEIGNERVYLRGDPSQFFAFADLCHGFKLPEGHTLGAQVIGRGGFTLQRITPLDPQGGAGNPTPMWTPGAQAVEVEVDKEALTYRLLNAWTAIDAGKVINPLLSEGLIMGGMSMGLSLASREGFIFDDKGQLETGNLRSYKPIRLGEEPRYHCAFVETPLSSAPYGARPIDEHGILGMPAALANALSRALGRPLNALPLVPEALWQAERSHA